MTVKTRGIKLKSKLPLEDQGQQKLLQVTYSQLAFMDQNRQAAHSEDDAPEPHGAGGLSQTRRRAIARMLRVELEATLAMLDQALADIRPAD